MTELHFEGRAAQSPEPRSVVVFLHGYGADGADLIGLADPLAAGLPRALFLSPHAPDPCAGNPFGRQWFPIPWLDGSTEAAAAEGLDRSAALLDRFLDAVLRDTGLAPECLALVGFSQGTMMALHVALRRAKPIGAVVGFSGRLLYPARLAAEIRARPPVLMLHGDADPVVPFDDLGRAETALAAAGVDVATHVMAGTGHGIAPGGLDAALHFLARRLGA